jgi:hypothetical protein
MEMRYWLLEHNSTTFVGVGRFYSSSCFKPQIISCEHDLPDDLAVVSWKNLKLVVRVVGVLHINDW